METLIFLPPFATDIINGDKTQTIRYGEKRQYHVHDVIQITVGWDKKASKNLCKAVISGVSECTICELPRLIQKELCVIYKTMFRPMDVFTIINFFVTEADK